MEEIIEPILHAVMYTDGSADNIKKIYGFGAHGYIYNKNDKKGKTSNRPPNYLVTSKGYIEPNEAKVPTIDEMVAYYEGSDKTIDELEELRKNLKAIVVDPIEYIDIYGADPEPGTNNVAEVLGVIETVLKLVEHKVKDILIYTDSNYTIGVIEKAKERSVEEIADKVNVNIDLWYRAKDMHKLLKEYGISFKIDKIKAHSGHIGNETADDLALLGRFESTRKTGLFTDFRVSSPKSYWKPKYERHTFLNSKQVFFTIDETKKTVDTEYFIFNYKNENEVGKRSHIASYGYVVLKEEDKYVEQIKNVFKKEMGNHSVPSTVRMDNLFKPDIFKYVERYGDMPLSMVNNKNHLMVLENEVVANAINPPALAYKAFDDMVELKMILQDYNKLKSDPEQNTFREYIDITDLFYTTNDKDKNIIKPELTNEVKTVDHTYEKDGRSAKIIIQLGTDIITRNQIKKLEKRAPKIKLVVDNKNNLQLKYFVLIDLEDTGDLSVWTNFYSNMVVMK